MQKVFEWGSSGAREAWIQSQVQSSKRSFQPGDILRTPHYSTTGKGRYRVWIVAGVHLGGDNQEGTYHLRSVDVLDGESIHVPCIILETHPLVELVS